MSKKSDKKKERGDKARTKLDPVGAVRQAVNKANTEIAEAIGMAPDDVELNVYYWE